MFSSSRNDLSFMLFFVSISGGQHLIGCFFHSARRRLGQNTDFCCRLNKINNPSKENCCLRDKINNPSHENCCLYRKMKNPSSDFCCFRDKMNNPSHNIYFLREADYQFLCDFSIPPGADIKKRVFFVVCLTKSTIRPLRIAACVTK